MTREDSNGARGDTVLLDQALEAGILEHAEANAVKVLTNFLLGLGYSQVQITFAD